MEVKNVTLKNGQKIEMRLSDEWDEITFYENGTKLSGEFQFIQNDYNDEKYLLSRMYSPIQKQGLGEHTLRFFIDITDGIIWARAHDGIVRDDGSNLTGDAPIFVGRMQTKGLIETDEESDLHLQDEDY